MNIHPSVTITTQYRTLVRRCTRSFVVPCVSHKHCNGAAKTHVKELRGVRRTAWSSTRSGSTATRNRRHQKVLGENFTENTRIAEGPTLSVTDLWALHRLLYDDRTVKETSINTRAYVATRRCDVDTVAREHV